MRLQYLLLVFVVAVATQASLLAQLQVIPPGPPFMFAPKPVKPFAARHISGTGRFLLRIDIKKGTADILISDAELAKRRAALDKNGGYRYPPSQTPWQEIERGIMDQLGNGMVLKPAV